MTGCGPTAEGVTGYKGGLNSRWNCDNPSEPRVRLRCLFVLGSKVSRLQHANHRRMQCPELRQLAAGRLGRNAKPLRGEWQVDLLSTTELRVVAQVGRLIRSRTCQPNDCELSTMKLSRPPAGPVYYSHRKGWRFPEYGQNQRGARFWVRMDSIWKVTPNDVARCRLWPGVGVSHFESASMRLDRTGPLLTGPAAF